MRNTIIENEDLATQVQYYTPFKGITCSLSSREFYCCLRYFHYILLKEKEIKIQQDTISCLGKNTDG